MRKSSIIYKNPANRIDWRDFFLFYLKFVVPLDKVRCISTIKMKKVPFLFCIVFDLQYLCTPKEARCLK